MEKGDANTFPNSVTVAYSRFKCKIVRCCTFFLDILKILKFEFFFLILKLDCSKNELLETSTPNK